MHVQHVAQTTGSEQGPRISFALPKEVVAWKPPEVVNMGDPVVAHTELARLAGCKTVLMCGMCANQQDCLLVGKLPGPCLDFVLKEGQVPAVVQELLAA